MTKERKDCPECVKIRNSTMDFIVCPECGTPSSGGKTFNPEECGSLLHTREEEPIKDRVSKKSREEDGGGKEQSTEQQQESERAAKGRRAENQRK